MPADASARADFSVSIVVATTGDSPQLRDCLAALRIQADQFIRNEGEVSSPDASVEIVLAVNTMPCHMAANTLSTFHAICDTILFDERPGKSNALNSAIDQCRAPVIVFTDDDTQPKPGWLQALASPLLEPNRPSDLAGCGGRVIPIFPEATPSWYRDLVFQSEMAVLGPRHDFGDMQVDYDAAAGTTPIGANCAYLRAVLIEERFSIELGPNAVTGMRGGEDIEFALRLMRSGLRIRYIGGAIVTHPVDADRLTLDFCRDRYAASGVDRIRRARVMGEPEMSSGRLRLKLAWIRFCICIDRARGRIDYSRTLRCAKLAGMLAEIDSCADAVLTPKSAPAPAAFATTAPRLDPIRQHNNPQH